MEVTRDDQGFTYVELAVVLSLLLLIIPVVLAVSLDLEQALKQLIAEQELRSEAEAFATDIQKDVQRGNHFRLSPEGWLLFDFPTGETLRYRHDRRRVIRSVKKPGHSAFRGTTVLLHNVYFISFHPHRGGVSIDLGMQNWHGDVEREFFIRGRLDE